MTIQDELRAAIALYHKLGTQPRKIAERAADRIDALEAENARLRGRVNELAAIVRDFGDSAEYAEGYKINTEPEA